MTMADGALERRVRALRAKLASLTSEVDAWQSVAQEPAFAIHRSQLEDVRGGLTAMHAMIAQEIDDAAAAGTLTLAAVERFERKILAALLVWESYRGKFALRLVPSLRLPLALVDELAWQAYAPPRDAAAASGAVAAVDVREPPLVFPNVRWSPFARSREQAYEIDESTGDQRALGDLDEWLRAMPVPVVGIPWYQMGHLPDAVFIGHEVGHLVEEDFGLTDSLRAAIGAALAGVDDVRRTAWMRHWRSEVFADVYGVLTTGSAYAAVLLDALAGDRAAIAAEVQPDPARSASQQWGSYPTRALRARVVCEAVRQLPADGRDPTLFSARADALEAAWTDAYDAHAMPPAYEADVPLVVRALMWAPLAELRTVDAPNGRAIGDVMRFGAALERRARDDAALATARKPVVGADTRALFAAVALAFVADPALFAATNAQTRFRDRLQVTRSQQPRAAGTPGFKPAAAAARHEAAGRALLGRLGQAAADG